jgi:hypothetical protein
MNKKIINCIKFIGKISVLFKNVKTFTGIAIDLVMMAERLYYHPKIPSELKKSIEQISSPEKERELMMEEDKYSSALNDLYKKRRISEKRMMDDYIRRENEWRRQDSMKMTEYNKMYLWNRENEERFRKKNKYTKECNKLYTFFQK